VWTRGKGEKWNFPVPMWRIHLGWMGRMEMMMRWVARARRRRKIAINIS
jgi:hypothetical protein